MNDLENDINEFHIDDDNIVLENLTLEEIDKLIDIEKEKEKMLQEEIDMLYLKEIY